MKRKNKNNLLQFETITVESTKTSFYHDPLTTITQTLTETLGSPM